MSKLESAYTVMHEAVNKMHKMHQQVKSITGGAKGDNHAEIRKAGTTLADRMKAWDGEMVQRLSKAYDDVENFENGFTAEWIFLINQTESDIPRVNQPNKDRYTELETQRKSLMERANKILNEDVPAFNDMLWKAGIGAIWVEE
jgi:hypothetical protein